MKNILLFICLSSALTLGAQVKKIKDKLVPPILNENFQFKFGNIRPTDWVFDSSCGCYKAHFIRKTNECTATFNREYRWTKTETEIDKGTIPDPIMVAFKASDYHDWKIVTTMRVELTDIPSGCQFNLKKDKERYFLIYDLNGKLLKQGKE